jgi:hypothetical protein
MIMELLSWIKTSILESQLILNLPYKLVLLQKQGENEGETKGKVFLRQ